MDENFDIESNVYKYYVKGIAQFAFPIFLAFYFIIYDLNLVLLLSGIVASFLIANVAYTNTHYINSHQLIKVNSKILRYVLNYISTVYVFTPPASWSFYHVLHHRYVDTELDPISPTHIGFFKVASFFNHKLDTIKKIPPYQQKKIVVGVKHLLSDPAAMFFEKYFLWLILLHTLALMYIDIELLVYFYVIPQIYIMCTEVIAFWAHSEKWGGNAPKNNSSNATNNYYLWWLVPFEALHADHHNGRDRYNPSLRYLKKLFIDK